MRSGFNVNTCDSVYPPPHLRLLLLLSGDVELNPGPITGKHTLNTTLINWYTTIGNPKYILRSYYTALVDAITNNLHRITNGLYSKGLIPRETVTHIQVATGISDIVKSSQLMATLQTQLEASLTPDQYLIDICHVLINQQHQTLTDIATNILHQLGKYTLMSSTVYNQKIWWWIYCQFLQWQAWLHVWCHIMLVLERIKIAMFKNQWCSWGGLGPNLAKIIISIVHNWGESPYWQVASVCACLLVFQGVHH